MGIWGSKLLLIIKKNRLDRVAGLLLLLLLIIPYQNCANTERIAGKMVLPSSGSGGSGSAPVDPDISGTVAKLPLTFETPYERPSGNTIDADLEPGGFQGALNRAQLGDTILLSARTVYTGPFTLPNKTTGSGWIYIQSKNYNNLPAPGTRVTPADAVNMPIIEVSTTSDLYRAAIKTDYGSHHYRFVGIEIRPKAGNYIWTLIRIWNAIERDVDKKYVWGDITLDTLPHHITFDRCYIHGDSTAEGVHGVAMNGPYVAVVDSHISSFKSWNADSQALWTSNSPGPIKLVNNYLEATGENFMSGGQDPTVPNLVPSDIEIRRNHFFKPLEWRNVVPTMVVKNLLEFKNGQRILVEGNTFENHWAASQSGYAIVITPRNQDNTAPWSVTRDITIKNNIIKNVGGGFNISARDSDYSSKDTVRVVIENNIIQVNRFNTLVYYDNDFTPPKPVYYMSVGNLFQILSGVKNLIINHNTAFISSAGIMTSEISSYKNDGVVFTNNLVGHGDSGVYGQGACCGTSVLNQFHINWTFNNNAMYGIQAAGRSASAYPTGNYFPTDINAIQFENYNAGNYRLSPTSPYKGKGTDGKDLGADLNAIAAALQN